MKGRKGAGGEAGTVKTQGAKYQKRINIRICTNVFKSERKGRVILPRTRFHDSPFPYSTEALLEPAVHVLLLEQTAPAHPRVVLEVDQVLRAFLPFLLVLAAL